MKSVLIRLTAGILILAVFAANFSALFIWVGFKLNQDYIAKTLCVNRSALSLHCNGKCYLMRKVKESAQKEKSTESQSQKNKLREASFTSNGKIRLYCQVVQVMPLAEHHLILPLIAIPVFQPPPLG